MRRQAERLLERGDEALLHDELASVNESVYFHQFAAHAGRPQLLYLAEADFLEIQIGTLPEQVAEELRPVEDPTRGYQYLDFLKGRCSARRCSAAPSWRSTELRERGSLAAWLSHRPSAVAMSGARMVVRLLKALSARP
jgi:Predicted methyltransferase regulatory domain